MADCKVLRFPFVGKQDERPLSDGTSVSEYPVIEEEINRFLRLGYEIKSATFSYGLIVVLERKG